MTWELKIAQIGPTAFSEHGVRTEILDYPQMKIGEFQVKIKPKAICFNGQWYIPAPDSEAVRREREWESGLSEEIAYREIKEN